MKSQLLIVPATLPDILREAPVRSQEFRFAIERLPTIRPFDLAIIEGRVEPGEFGACLGVLCDRFGDDMPAVMTLAASVGACRLFLIFIGVTNPTPEGMRSVGLGEVNRFFLRHFVTDGCERCKDLWKSLRLLRQVAGPLREFLQR